MAEIASAWVSLLPSAEGFGRKMESQVSGEVSGAGKRLGSSFGKMFAVAGGAIAAVGIGGFFKSAIADASDVSESASKVGVVFGKSADQILRASRTSATAMGLSKGAYLDAAGTLGNLLVSLDIAPKKAAGLSQQMVKLAGDMASFNNVSPEEALDALRSGLTGETEPLKRFGVNMNDATLHAQALKMGLISNIKDALTPQAKALAAQGLIMKQTRTAQGDFQRTSGGLANQQRILAAQFANVKATVGSALLPIVTRFVKFLNGSALPGVRSFIAGLKSGEGIGGQVAAAFSRVSGAVRGFIADFKAGVGVGGQFAAAFSAIGSVLTALGSFMLNNKAVVGTFVGVVLTLVAAVKVWTIAQAALNFVLAANPIGIVIVAIAALAAGIVYAYQKSETFRTVINGVFEFLKTAVTAVVSFVTDHWKLIVVAITGPLGAVALLVVKHWTSIKSFVTNAVSTIVNFVRDHWRLIVTIIGGPLGLAVALVTKYWGQIKAATSAVWSAIKSYVSTNVAAIKGAVNGLSDLVGKVRGFFQAILEAVKNKLESAVKVVSEFPGKAARALGDLTNTLYSYGRNLIQGFINGIKDKAGEIVGAVTGPISSAIKGVGSLLKIGSPSKLFHQIGQWTMEGFANGIDSAGPKVLKAMQSALEKTLDKVSAFRDGIASRLDSVKSSFSSLKDSIASTFSGDLFNVSAIASSLTDTTFTAAQTVGQAFTSGLLDTRGRLKDLLAAFKTLKNWGLSGEFLSQLFASGNSALILEMAGGTRAQAQADASLFGDVQSLSNQLGTQVARNQYGADLRDIRGELKRANDHLKHLDNLEHKLARALSGAVSHGQKKGAAG